jgi:hypothetical protein
MTQEEFLYKREEKLIEEARSSIGMLAEVAAKARLLVNKINQKQTKKIYSVSDAQNYADRLNDDYDRYTCRINEINDELTGVYYELDKFFGLDS